MNDEKRRKNLTRRTNGSEKKERTSLRMDENDAGKEIEKKREPKKRDTNKKKVKKKKRKKSFIKAVFHVLFETINELLQGGSNGKKDRRNRKNGWKE